MPSLQSLIATLNISSGVNPTESLVSNPAVVGKGQGGGNFSSLLDVLGNFSDNNVQAGNSPKELSKLDDRQEPVAAEFPTPVAFRNSVSDDRNNEDSFSGSGGYEDGDKIKHGRLESVAKPAGASGRPLRDAGDSKTKIVESSGKQELLARDDYAIGGDIDEDIDTKEPTKFRDLQSLLDIIAQFFAGSNGTENPALQLVQVSQINVTSQIGFTVANVNSANIDAQVISDPLPVLADLSDVLGQLQQFLRIANAQNTPLTEQQNGELSAINEALKNDLDALKNLLGQKLNGNSVLSSLLNKFQIHSEQVIVDTNLPPEIAKIADLKSLLQSDISLIQDALKKFKNDVEIQPLPNLVATKFQANTQLPVTAITNSGDNNGAAGFHFNDERIESAIFSVTSAITSSENKHLAPVLLNQNNNDVVGSQAVAIQAVVGSDSGTNSGGSFSNNSGQQGGNAQGQVAFGGTASTSARIAGGTTATQFSNLLNRIEATPVTEQIVFHVKTAVGSGDSKITIQLHPEELGKLDVTLDIDAKGKAGVTIIADNKQTLDLLQRDSQGLQKALSDAGLKADSGSLSFNLRGGEREGQGQNQSQASSHYQRSQPEEALLEELNVASLASVTRSYVIGLPDGLDIKI